MSWIRGIARGPNMRFVLRQPRSSCDERVQPLSAARMTRFSFSIGATDGAARTGIDLDAARRHPDAGVHAGRHGGDGQGDAARGGARERRRHHPWQYLSFDAPPGRRAGREARRASQVHGLGPADPDRQRRLSGDEPQRADQGHRGGRLLRQPPRRVAPHAVARAVDRGAAAARTATSSCSSTSWCRPLRRARRSARRWSARSAGRSAAATNSTAAASIRSARPSSASSRARSTRSCAGDRPRL